MKYLLVLTLCLLVVLEVSLAQSEQPSEEPRTLRPSRRPPPPSRPSPPPPPPECKTSDDCQQGECCVSHDMFGFRRAHCHKLADKGKPCSLPERTVRGKYLNNCPCVGGLSCEAERVRNIPFVGEIRINERCAVLDATSPEPETEVTA
ncbi:hypothetical protein JTE90_009898 [Oedothorax gibbosus]|uniref:Prokineticin domain-containing protein n=1 Tax=Oedothorax gibbosus TaxID=931172 RepID=A0AAV6UV04_9ARAC|nr:hypothetical protein JTE90_009898 [Oedothorax gibbosus]